MGVMSCHGEVLRSLSAFLDFVSKTFFRFCQKKKILCYYPCLVFTVFVKISFKMHEGKELGKIDPFLVDRAPEELAVLGELAM